MLIESTKCQHRWNRWREPSLKAYIARCSLCGKEVHLPQEHTPWHAPRPSFWVPDMDEPYMEEGTSQQAPRGWIRQPLAERLRRPFSVLLLLSCVAAVGWVRPPWVMYTCCAGLFAVLAAFEYWRHRTRLR